MHTIPVEAPSGAYPAIVAPELVGLGAAMADAGYRRAVIVTDAHVAPHWLAAATEAIGVPSSSVVLPPGEAHKDRDAWWTIVDAAIRAGVDRQAPIVALGGGVVGDLTGFAAATVARGVPFVQVPTTLLAMVDASVGGKTGFNHPLGKNLVGAFHQPSLVWMALATLTTLPDRERRAGLAEVVKHALLTGEDWLARLEADAPALEAGDPTATADAIVRSIRCKAAIVAADERETGLRECLNLGHTVGHAIEAVAGYGTWLHGEAVAIGLIAELQASAPALAERVAALLGRLGLPTCAPTTAVGVTGDDARTALRQAMTLDKKTRGAMVSLPICTSAGQFEVRRVSPADVARLV